MFSQRPRCFTLTCEPEPEPSPEGPLTRVLLPQLHLLVSSSSVKLKVDCQEVEEKKTKTAGNVSRDGYQVLGKMAKSIGSKGQSATVSQRPPNHHQEPWNRPGETKISE